MWKLSNHHNLTTLALQWKTNLGQPSNPLLLFPPSLLTATSMLSTEPTSWSLELVNNTIHCVKTWSTDPASTTGSTDPVSPMPSRLDDSGYASPAHSPIPFVLPSKDCPGPLTSPAISKTTMDATTETTLLPTCSSSSQTPPTATLVETGTQPSLLPETTTLDATTTTTSYITISCSSQTPATTQASTISTNATQDAQTQSANPLHEPTQNAATESPPDPASPSTSTLTQDNPSPSYIDASTSYEPPPINRWCQFCHSAVSPDEPPLIHLVGQCGATPEELLQPLDKLNHEFGQRLKIPRRAVRAASTLVLSRHDPTAKTPHDLITEFVMNLIPDYDEYRSFIKTTDDLTSSLISKLKSHLAIDPSTKDLSAIFTDIEPFDPPSSDDDADSVYDAEPDWADLAEYYSYLGHDDAYDECY